MGLTNSLISVALIIIGLFSECCRWKHWHSLVLLPEGKLASCFSESGWQCDRVTTV